MSTAHQDNVAGQEQTTPDGGWSLVPLDLADNSSQDGLENPQPETHWALVEEQHQDLDTSEEYIIIEEPSDEDDDLLEGQPPLETEPDHGLQDKFNLLRQSQEEQNNSAPFDDFVLLEVPKESESHEEEQHQSRDLSAEYEFLEEPSDEDSDDALQYEYKPEHWQQGKPDLLKQSQKGESPSTFASYYIGSDNSTEEQNEDTGRGNVLLNVPDSIPPVSIVKDLKATEEPEGDVDLQDEGDEQEIDATDELIEEPPEEEAEEEEAEEEEAEEEEAEEEEAEEEEAEEEEAEEEAEEEEAEEEAEEEEAEEEEAEEEEAEEEEAEEEEAEEEEAEEEEAEEDEAEEDEAEEDEAEEDEAEEDEAEEDEAEEDEGQAPAEQQRKLHREPSQGQEDHFSDYDESYTDEEKEEADEWRQREYASRLSHRKQGGVNVAGIVQCFCFFFLVGLALLKIGVFMEQKEQEMAQYQKEITRLATINLDLNSETYKLNRDIEQLQAKVEELSLTKYQFEWLKDNYDLLTKPKNTKVEAAQPAPKEQPKAKPSSSSKCEGPFGHFALKLSCIYNVTVGDLKLQLGRMMGVGA